MSPAGTAARDGAAAPASPFARQAKQKLKRAQEEKAAAERAVAEARAAEEKAQAKAQQSEATAASFFDAWRKAGSSK